jgi:hypothetical protein
MTDVDDEDFVPDGAALDTFVESALQHGQLFVLPRHEVFNKC